MANVVTKETVVRKVKHLATILGLATLALSLTSCGPVAPSVDKSQFLASQSATSGPQVNSDLFSIQVLPVKTQVLNMENTAGALKDTTDIIKVVNFSKNATSGGLSDFSNSGKMSFELSFDGLPAKQVVAIIKTNKSSSEISSLGFDAARLSLKQTGETKWSLSLAAGTAAELATAIQTEAVEITLAFTR